MAEWFKAMLLKSIVRVTVPGVRIPPSPPSIDFAVTLDDIEKAVAELPPDQLLRFRAWFEEFEAARFDDRIERDAKAGRLDRLAEQPLSDFRAGRAREL